MPVLPPANSTSTITWQVLPNPNVTPFVNQANFGQMIGWVLQHNPDIAAYAPVLLNASARKVYDRRTWFPLLVKGQLQCPVAVTQGSATVTNGSNVVQGINTTWDASLVGRQFRIGYNNPLYTITGVDPVGQQLQLELPWGGTSTTSGYFIIQYYFNLGPNVKYVYLMVNMQLGYKFWCRANQNFLNSLDPWRQNQNWPYILSPMPLGPNGEYLVELYPASWILQAFPFMAYVQPPNMVDDTDSLPAFIRADIVVKDAIAQALTWRGPKKNPYYDKATSDRFVAEFESELNNMAMADENLNRQNLSLLGEDMPYFNGSGGALWDASHAVTVGQAGGSAYGDGF